MTLAPRHRYTFQDYLDVEEISPVKHEYFDGEIYAMAGGTPEHAALAAVLIGRLTAALRGSPCRAYTSDLRLRVRATGLATYPDVAVVCGSAERDPESPTHVTNPALVIEVLSKGTEEYDRGEKREHYQQMESLREYVLVAQAERRVEVWRRTHETQWSHQAHGPGELVVLDSVSCTLDVDELYEDAGV